MRILFLTVVLVVAACAQVAVAPLFPISGATPDFGLVSLLVLAFFAGPGPTTLALPFFAVCLGFLSGREPGLMLLGYLPLLPLALWFENAPMPLSGAGRFLGTGLGAGLSLRLALSMGAVLRGAPLGIGPLVFSVLLPGLLIDLGLLALVYIICRMLRWDQHRMTLRRGSYYP